MKKLLVYLRDYKKEAILGPLFKLLEASLELLIPLLVIRIVDDAIPSNNDSYLLKMCGLMVLLGTIGLVFSVTAQYFAAKASVGFAKKMRHALFAKIQSFSFTQLDTLGTSTMITRMTSDINQIQNGVNLSLRLFLRSPFIVFGSMLMAFTISPKISLLFLITIALLSVVVFGLLMATMPMYKKVQKRLDEVLKITKENLTGVRILRAFAKEEEETDKFHNANKMLAKLSLFVGRISSFMNPVTYVIINFALILLLQKGAIFVDTGILTQGAVIALVNYMSQILVELIKLANLMINMSKMFACANRVSDVLELPCDSLPQTQTACTPDAFAPLLSFSHVNMRYENAGGDSLTDINFTVQKGQVIGIIGGTGSGKSSLVHLICGFYSPSNGSILYHGKPLSDYPAAQLRKNIAIVMQRAVLFKGTVRENLKWGKEDATDEEIWAALTTAQAADFIKEKKGMLDFMITEGGKNLSGGQRQRLTIARALAAHPEILILDDSASALDYATEARLREALKRDLKDTTVFLISQRASSLLAADHIIVMEDGQVDAFGTHKELLQNSSVYQEIYYSQYPKEEADA